MADAPGGSQSSSAAPAAAFELTTSRQFTSWLAEQKASLAFTTYQAGKLFLLGLQPDGRLSIFNRTFERCMGLWASPERLLMSTLYQLWRFENALVPGQTHGGYDRLYVGRMHRRLIRGDRMKMREEIPTKHALPLLAASLVFVVSAGLAAGQSFDAELELGGSSVGAWLSLYGASFGETAGWSVAGAGDANGDGIDDLLVSAPSAGPNGSSSGRAYVVFGTDGGFPPELELADLLAANGGDGALGFALNGAAQADNAGVSVAGAGDVNGDAIDDLLIAAPGADPNGSFSGQAYVVFGTDGGFPPELELADLLAANGGDGTLGFALNGAAQGDEVGWSVAGTGDVNGDGIDDLLVGAPSADPNGRSSGQAYVVFGTDIGFPPELELGDLLAINGGDGTLGFALNGLAAGDQAGRAGAGAGDVNGDGLGDLIVGARAADPNGLFSGQAYVVFGTDIGFPPELELGDLLAINGGDGTLGFALNGAAQGDEVGWSVAGTGDVNGDSVHDLIVGAPGADSHGLFSGQAYVVFGRNPAAAIERLIGRVEAAGLPGGIENSLTSKLNSALGLLARDNTTGAIRKVGDFIDQVEAQSGKQIDQADADLWIAAAETILDMLSTSLSHNRRVFVDALQ